MALATSPPTSTRRIRDDDPRIEHGVGFFNSGQVCTSVERVYAEQGIHDAFVEVLTAQARRLRHGPDSVAGVSEIGAMANDAQVAIVTTHVDEAVAGGARVLIGGAPGDGNGSGYQPTVLVDVDQSMKIMREETFGPTLPIMNAAPGRSPHRGWPRPPTGCRATRTHPGKAASCAGWCDWPSPRDIVGSDGDAVRSRRTHGQPRGAAAPGAG